MSLPIFTLVKRFIKILFLLSIIVDTAYAWKIDLSRRASEMRGPASVSSPVVDVPAPKVLQKIFPSTASHEVVILNTSKGFVPDNIQLKKGERYTVHVVNVNEKDKNISFILDSFAQHFGTFYGKTKSFVVEPKKEGVFTFISPEVAAEGKIVVINPQPKMRAPASTDK